MRKNLKIAFVYDWLDKWGGVERLLLVLHRLYPKADFFTSYYNQKTASWAKTFPIHNSFINKLPDFIKKNRILSLPFLPRAFESFNFRHHQYDLIVSITSSFAKSIITSPDTCHICYLLTPTRFLWEDQKVYFPNPLERKLLTPYLNYLKRWDRAAAMRPDYYLAISQAVAERTQKYYGQKAKVVYPAFDLDYWIEIEKKASSKNLKVDFSQFYLAVARLEPYKKIDFLVNYFSKHPEKNLIVVGEGTQKKLLQKKIYPNIQFLGLVKDEELSWLYQNAQALVMPQKEDFGYTALEAQFFGCPVIALAQGGALETVISQEAGIFFPKLDLVVFEKTLASFESIAYNLKSNLKKKRLQYLDKFSLKNFQVVFPNLLIQYYQEYESNNFCRRNRDASLASFEEKIS